MKKLHTSYLIIFSLLALWSCSDCEPISDPGNELVLSFNDIDELRDNNRLLRKGISFIEVSEEAQMLPIENLPDTSNRYEIPLPFDRLEATYIFKQEGITIEGSDTTTTLFYDTLGVNFKRSLKPISPDCGFYEEISNITINYSTFDSTVFFFDQTTANDTINIYVFH